MPLLDVAYLSKSFGDLKAVDDVSFQVEAGDVFGLLGPNGAGKSTTMMMLAGLLEPDGGSVTFDGVRLEPTGGLSRTAMGVVPQDLAIYPELSARENLYFFGRLYGIDKAELKTRIDRVLERIGLSERQADRTGEYSGGMKRRLNFGVALLHEPKLLILDEPTVGVDPQSRSHLLEGVRELAADGMACIYASHYMEEVQSICRRVAIVDHGRILACDEVDSLLESLNNELCLEVAELTDELRSRLASVAEVRDPDENNSCATVVISRDQLADEKRLADLLTEVLRIVRECDVRVLGVETREPNLERLFLQLTGTRLRD